jgi:hypothetical protein
MARSLTGIVVALAAVVIAASAQADIYADDLGRCFVKSASKDDQLTLVRWMFVSIALQPALQPLAAITPEQRDSYAKDVAALYERLLYVDCRKEAVVSLRNEGPQSLSLGIRVLGAVVARMMLNDPQVARNSSGLMRFADKSKMSALYKEAGVPEPPSAPAPVP